VTRSLGCEVSARTRGRHLILACALSVLVCGSGCFGAAAYVIHRQTLDIPNPEVYSPKDRKASRGLAYVRRKLPEPARIEKDGDALVLHYERQGFILGGLVVFVAPGYPLGFIFPMPFGRQKASLRFKNGTLVSTRATVTRQSGLAFLYVLRTEEPWVLFGRNEPIGWIGQYQIRSGEMPPAPGPMLPEAP
jgi:hypothetical protein